MAVRLRRRSGLVSPYEGAIGKICDHKNKQAVDGVAQMALKPPTIRSSPIHPARPPSGARS